MQIKTISVASHEEFDKQVNKALEDGWELRRRGVANFAYYAEMVKGEKKCSNCCHQNTDPYKEPCSTCNEDYSEWSPVAEDTCESN